jgi:hypothetical protein
MGASMTCIALVPFDTRNDQIERADKYLMAHPGCTRRELERGAELGCATKVVSVMNEPERGYQIDTEEAYELVCRDTRKQETVRYWLKRRPEKSQQELELDPAE